MNISGKALYMHRDSGMNDRLVWYLTYKMNLCQFIVIANFLREPTYTF